MFASRRNRRLALGLWSTAMKIMSPSTTKVLGTTCGPPPAPTVASRTTGTDPNRSRAPSTSSLGIQPVNQLPARGRLRQWLL